MMIDDLGILLETSGGYYISRLVDKEFFWSIVLLLS